MAVSHVSNGTGHSSGASTSKAVDMPNGLAAGDTVVVGFCVNNTPTVSASGWTSRIFEGINGAALAVLTRRVDDAGTFPTSVTFTLSNSQRANAGASAWRGVDPDDPIDVIGTFAEVGVANSVTAPSVTTTENGGMALAFCAVNSSSNDWTTPWTEDFALVGDQCYGQAHLAMPTAGATGGATFGLDGKDSGAVILALRAAPTGGAVEGAPTDMVATPVTLTPPSASTTTTGTPTDMVATPARLTAPTATVEAVGTPTDMVATPVTLTPPSASTTTTGQPVDMVATPATLTAPTANAEVIGTPTGIVATPVTLTPPSASTITTGTPTDMVAAPARLTAPTATVEAVGTPTDMVATPVTLTPPSASTTITGTPTDMVATPARLTAPRAFNALPTRTGARTTTTAAAPRGTIGTTANRRSTTTHPARTTEAAQ